MNLVIYGGQYGSEGKASACEYWIKRLKSQGRKIAVVGENSPNSGHTCSLGSTKNIPASSFFADLVLLGADSVIDREVLASDLEKTKYPKVYIHEHAAVLNPSSKNDEADLVKRISSTGSGSGMARKAKFIDRVAGSVIKGQKINGVNILDFQQWDNLLKWLRGNDYSIIFECSQGTLLDTNFGIFPYCTSRSTLPRVAIERNGLGWLDWTYAGVYRTYPIRTGGPSGPTGGDELSWQSLGVKPEIATVTKRVRRVFEFSEKDFCKSLSLNRPDYLMFTFLDYIGVDDLKKDQRVFQEWLEFYNISEVRRLPVLISNKTGVFEEYHRQ